MALSSLGTTDYISPEMLSAMEYKEGFLHGVECDIWSLGIVIHECFTGEPPFYDSDIIETFTRIRKCDYDPTKYPQIPLELHDLLRNLLCPMEKRWSLDQVKQYEFFNERISKPKVFESIIKDHMNQEMNDFSLDPSSSPSISMNHNDDKSSGLEGIKDKILLLDPSRKETLSQEKRGKKKLISKQKRQFEGSHLIFCGFTNINSDFFDSSFNVSDFKSISSDVNNVKNDIVKDLSSIQTGNQSNEKINYEFMLCHYETISNEVKDLREIITNLKVKCEILFAENNSLREEREFLKEELIEERDKVQLLLEKLEQVLKKNELDTIMTPSTAIASLSLSSPFKSFFSLASKKDNASSLDKKTIKTLNDKLKILEHKYLNVCAINEQLIREQKNRKERKDKEDLEMGKTSNSDNQNDNDDLNCGSTAIASTDTIITSGSDINNGTLIIIFFYLFLGTKKSLNGSVITFSPETTMEKQERKRELKLKNEKQEKIIMGKIEKIEKENILRGWFKIQNIHNFNALKNSALKFESPKNIHLLLDEKGIWKGEGNEKSPLSLWIDFK